MAITGANLYKYKDSKTNKTFYFIGYLTDSTSVQIYSDDIRSYITSSNISWNYPLFINAVSEGGAYINHVDNYNGDLVITATSTTTTSLSYLYTINGVSSVFTSPISFNNQATLTIPIFCYNPDNDYIFTNSSLSALLSYYLEDYRANPCLKEITTYPLTDSLGTGIYQGFHLSLTDPYPFSGLYTTNPYILSRDNSYSAQINFIRALIGLSEIIDTEDPYNGNDNSAPGGGNGDFNYDSDSDDIPDLPTASIADSGFVTLYAPTLKQLKELASYLWSDTFSIDTFKKMFNNPMECILGLSLVPVNLPHGTAQEITVGNLVSTVSCDKCTSQYVYIECGSININASSFTNSYLDFSPYTEISIYLPFIGTQPLDVDEIMNSTITVTYHVDVLTGAMCCFVKVAHTNPISGKETSSVLYTFMGQCCESVPLSSNSWSDTIGSILNAAASIGGVVATAATGGAAAPVALGMLGGATTATVNAAQSMKPTVNHSGSMGGGGGMMAQRTPKLIMKAPNISKPTKQYSYTGYPVDQTKALSECSGFTIVQDINLVVSDEGIGATQEELNEIERLLKTGVFI